MTELINGEVKQLTNKGAIDFDVYIEKNYLKTGALLAHGLKAISELSPSFKDMNNASNLKLHNDIFEFGKNVGIAFQIVDDCLDFTVDDITSGKPSQGADMKLGLATAPVLFAAEESRVLRKIMKREFREEGDVSYTLQIVKNLKGVDKSQKLAREYVDKGVEHLEKHKDSFEGGDAEWREVVDLIEYVLNRNR